MGTAKSKLKYLWDEITSDSSSWKWPSLLELAGIFVESMEPTFSTKGDCMPPGNFYGLRGKLIHSIGVVGKVKFHAEPGSPFTGIFRGATHGLVRFSAAKQPTPSTSLGPGMGLKFLRDTMDSANLVAMYRVDGQPGDWNFFANSFTTTIPDSKDAGV